MCGTRNGSSIMGTEDTTYGNKNRPLDWLLREILSLQVHHETPSEMKVNLGRVQTRSVTAFAFWSFIFEE